MGFFSKSPKPNPKIIVEGVEVSFNKGFEGWAFKYRNIDFVCFSSSFAMPSKAELDTILADLESLKLEVRSRLQKGVIDSGLKLDDGETFMVDIKDFAADKTFIVTWSDGASWGDMGADFIIKNRQIIDEAWGD